MLPRLRGRTRKAQNAFHRAEPRKPSPAKWLRSTLITTATAARVPIRFSNQHHHASAGDESFLPLAHLWFSHLAVRESWRARYVRPMSAYPISTTCTRISCVLGASSKLSLRPMNPVLGPGPLFRGALRFTTHGRFGGSSRLARAFSARVNAIIDRTSDASVAISSSDLRFVFQSQARVSHCQDRFRPCSVKNVSFPDLKRLPSTRVFSRYRCHTFVRPRFEGDIRRLLDIEAPGVTVLCLRKTE